MPERRAATEELIAELNRYIAAASALADDPRLTPEERDDAEGWLEFYRRSAERAERLLARA